MICVVYHMAVGQDEPVICKNEAGASAFDLRGLVVEERRPVHHPGHIYLHDRWAHFIYGTYHGFRVSVQQLSVILRGLDGLRPDGHVTCVG